MNLIKARGGKGSRPFSLERLATFPPQVDHVLVVLFFIPGGPGGGGAVLKLPDTFIVFIFKNPHIIGPAQFKPVLFKGHIQNKTNYFKRMCLLITIKQ